MKCRVGEGPELPCCRLMALLVVPHQHYHPVSVRPM